MAYPSVHSQYIIVLLTVLQRPCRDMEDNKRITSKAMINNITLDMNIELLRNIFDDSAFLI